MFFSLENELTKMATHKNTYTIAVFDCCRDLAQVKNTETPAAD